MTTEMISQPAFAHLASVPPMENSWSSGCAWMLIASWGIYSSLIKFSPVFLLFALPAPVPQAQVSGGRSPKTKRRWNNFLTMWRLLTCTARNAVHTCPGRKCRGVSSGYRLPHKTWTLHFSPDHQHFITDLEQPEKR